MFDTIAGLPVHPLVVHAVVVLGPLAALLAVLYAVKPAWRHGLKWPTLLTSGVAAVFAFVATQSGESFQKRVGDPAYDHAEKGDLAAIAVYVLFGAVLLLVFWLARPTVTATSVASILVASAAALFLLFGIVNAGHSGAKSVWHDQVSGSTAGAGAADSD